MDKITNYEIHIEVQVYSILDKMKEYRARRFKYLQRIDMSIPNNPYTDIKKYICSPRRRLEATTRRV